MWLVAMDKTKVSARGRYLVVFIFLECEDGGRGISCPTQ